jgi:1-acyl-sn-glycerol-3-phosphate acyltransferase
VAWTRQRGPGLIWRLTQIVVLPVFRAIITLRIRPGSALPQTGPFILSPNHYSEADPVVMGVATWRLGRIPRFLAKASLFRVPVLGSYLRRAGHIPVERGAHTTTLEPLEATKRLVEKGQGVIIYPEGTLTEDPDLWPMSGKTGAVRMALEGNIPLYPAAHWGTHSFMGRYEARIRLFPRPHIDVVVGPELNLDRYRNAPITRELLQDATDDLMKEISRLVGELRGQKPPAGVPAPAGQRERTS